MKINENFLFTTVIVVLILLFCNLILSANQSFEAMEKLGCASYFINDMWNANDLMQLCNNDNCTAYFESKMEQDIKLAEECLK